MDRDATLLCLPVEVRLHIYSYLFQNDWKYIDAYLGPTAPRQQQRRPPILPSLLQACQTISDEAKQAYFRNLKVYFDISSSTRPVGLINWINDIGTINVQHLRHFRVRWRNYVDIDIDLSRTPSDQRTVEATSQSEPLYNNHAYRCLPSLPTSSKRGLHARHPSVQAPLVPPPSTPLKLPVTSLPMRSKSDLPVQSTAKATPTQTKTSSPMCVRRNETRLPSTTRIGAKHVLTVKAVPVPGFDVQTDYWANNGTPQFCELLSKYLSQRLDELFDRDGLYLKANELVDFIAELDEHASALRWLWYW